MYTYIHNIHIYYYYSTKTLESFPLILEQHKITIVLCYFYIIITLDKSMKQERGNLIILYVSGKPKSLSETLIETLRILVY